MFDDNPEAAYAILRILHGKIEVSHHRCAYDVEAVVKVLSERQLPPVYGAMFRMGRKMN